MMRLLGAAGIALTTTFTALSSLFYLGVVFYKNAG
jgi:hypothetical protein